MKQWIALFGLLALQAHAEVSTVIDQKAVGAPSTVTSTPTIEPIPSDSQLEANDANRARLKKGGKVSLRQQVAVDKATIADSNKSQGKDFLASNKSKPGVITLPSGVQYKIIRAGKGKKPRENSVVLCHNRGTLIDGSEFEHDTKQPVWLNVAGLVPGLKEAVLLMPAGSKWQIVVPPDHAYGDKGYRGIGANAVVIYDFELISIQ